MSARISFSSEEKAKILSAVPREVGKIVTASYGRIHHAHLDSPSWTYLDQEGAIALIYKQTNERFYFCMIDLNGTKGVTWEHELQAGSAYFQERPFLHSFPGDDCMIGFAFADERDANTFYRKLKSRSKWAGALKENKNVARKSSSSSGKKGAKIDISSICGPSDFQHVDHMGYSEENGFVARHADQSWTDLINTLGQYGLSEEDMNRNKDFIREFLEKAEMEGLEAANKELGVPGAGEAKKTPHLPRLCGPAQPARVSPMGANEPKL